MSNPHLQSPPFQGASSPLVVKFADTEKDKMMRRMNSSVGLVYAGFPAMAGSVNQYAMYQQVRF